MTYTDLKVKQIQVLNIDVLTTALWSIEAKLQNKLFRSFASMLHNAVMTFVAKRLTVNVPVNGIG